MAPKKQGNSHSKARRSKKTEAAPKTNPNKKPKTVPKINSNRVTKAKAAKKPRTQ
jgi:hypothetical protein